ncbi:MAG: hypothetical protein DMG68_15185 [Acidobacteria bacterium]|nr:MAG: hypothetical protein DMG68_15185 [Acidobacteriota bacterium]
MSRNPLFQVMIALQDAPETLIGRDLRFMPLDIETGTETLDLSVSVIEHGERLEAQFSYNTDLFFDSTIERMVGHFRILLEAVAINADRKLSELPLLTESELHQLLVDCNDTSVQYPNSDFTISRFIEEQAERTPDALALIAGTQQLTFRQLNERANQVAHYLRHLDVGAEVLVGICMERTAGMLIGILGILKAGGAYVPLDPAYPKDRIAFVLEDCRASVLLTQESVLGALPETSAKRILLDSEWHVISGESSQNPVPVATPKNLAYLIYTSGSTGQPKGVAIEHRSAATFINWALSVFSPQELGGVLLSTSICFDLSVFEMFVPLSVGGKVILAQNALELPSLPAAEEVTLINTVPSALAELLRMGGVPDSVMTVNLAGEPLPRSLVRQIYAKKSIQRVYNLYGPTEDTTYSTFTLVPNDDTPVTIGRPIANTEAYVVDKHMQPVPRGLPGELLLGGEGLARGYFGRPELTKEKFIPDRFSKKPGARLYRTGDLVRYLPDGSLLFLGRIDYQVKIRGFRIELGEVEAALTKHPEIRQALVTVREDHGEKRLVAYLLAESSPAPSTGSLRNFLKQSLPDYMIPSSFVALDQFPLTPNGKIDRKALPAPEPERRDGGAVFAPRNDLEAKLVSLFQSVLRVPQVGVTDDFFDLGGHSLQAARLVAEIHEATGTQIPLSLFFRGATVEYLARVIQKGVDLPPEPVAMPIQTGESGAVFFAVVPPGENAVGYAKLARHMGSNQRFVKLQGPGTVLVDRPYTNEEMQKLADEYVDAMRSLQPTGPYYFGGMCDGAHIALRMAHRLDQLGDKVGMLAVFDTWVLENSQRLLPWYIHYYSQRYQEFRNLSLGKQVQVASRTLENMMTKILRSSPKRSPWSEAYWPHANFVPPTFSGVVTLFKRPKQPYYYVRDPKMGWASRALGGVDVQVLPIHHNEMLHDPNVRILGERLAECLRKSYCSQLSKVTGEENGMAVPVGRETESEVS